jgi:hypothetical protein
MWKIVVISAVVTIIGCAAPAKKTGVSIPTISLRATPAEVRSVILAIAEGRRIEKINYVRQPGGPIYRAFINDKAGPQLLTLDCHGKILSNAVIVPFADMPEAVRKAALTGVAGKLEICRKSILPSEPVYFIDYMLGEDEPVFAIIEPSGFVRALVGYAEEDPD